jgi:hypothetical protein
MKLLIMQFPPTSCHFISLRETEMYKVENHYISHLGAVELYLWHGA